MIEIQLSKGLSVSKLGYGCMSLSPNIYKPDPDYTDEKGIEVLKYAIDAGITHLDTAIVYGFGHNETLVGKAIKGYPREKLVIATKTGFDKGGVSGKPEFIRRTCLESLERLQVSYIDIFYLHRIDKSTPIEETMHELKKLVQEGKIKHIGLSEASAQTIKRAHAVHPVTAVQIEWSLWTRDAEAEIIPTCRALGIGIVAYSPLGRGVLAGGIKKADDLNEGDWRSRNARFQGENLEKNVKAADKVAQMAAKKGCSAGQLSLAWVMAQGDDVCPIPGTSKIHHLKDNIGALDVSLSAQELAELSSLISPDEIVGERYGAEIPTFQSDAA